MASLFSVLRCGLPLTAGIANILTVVTAALAGLALATVLHEWSHFAGAHFGGASYSVTPKPGFFVYEFDFENSSLRQFYSMSLSGQGGSWLAVVLIALMIPLDNAGRTMLLSAAVGSAVYGGVIEWPVLRRTQLSSAPLEELMKIDQTVLRRAGVLAGATTMVTWWLLPA